MRVSGRRGFVLGATAVALALIAAVAAATPVHVWHAVGFKTRPTPPAGLRTGKPAPTHKTPGIWSVPDWLTGVGVALLSLFALGLAALLIFGYWDSRRGRRQRPPEIADPDPDAADVPDLPERLAATTSSQLSALYEGAPRNAIVACWLALEEVAADVGIPRRPAETSAEFTRRVLARYVVDSTAINELAVLYREARFSEHALTEVHRRAAIDALGALDTALRRRESISAH